MKTRAIVCILLACVAKANELPGRWSGDYPPCDGHAELVSQGGLELGVRFSTTRRDLAEEFASAMDFWASILDLEWHAVDNSSCAIQLVDGPEGFFKPAQVARAQFPDAPSFQGIIAFNPAVSLTRSELFLAAVHEVGHVLGLEHSSHSSSLMYFLRTDGPLFLDEADLQTLATRHKLRLRTRGAPVLVSFKSFQQLSSANRSESNRQVRRLPSANGRFPQFHPPRHLHF